MNSTTYTHHAIAYRGDLDCPEMKDGIDVEIKQCGVLEAICGGFSVDAKPDVCFTASQCPLGVTHRDACGICGGMSERLSSFLFMPI